MENKYISYQAFQKERSLYDIKNCKIDHCFFGGPEDGESPLKECDDIIVSNCKFSLRYALWHDTNLTLNDSYFSNDCRAPLWYGKHLLISNCIFNGVKVLRECQDIKIHQSNFHSDEFGWKNKKLNIVDCQIESEYALLLSEDVNIDNCYISSKYSFQYMKNSCVSNSTLKAKDGFWHSENVTIKNCYIEGEFFAWYANNLTLINCTISGTQPFCYCKHLTLIDCQMANCDLAFEYSDVKAKIIGSITSIKNPSHGVIEVDEVKEIIDNQNKYPSDCKIIVKHYFE